MESRGLRFGFTGWRIICIRASWGVRPPLRTLQATHAQTMFSHVVPPPRLRGTTWSSDSSLVGKLWPQYWH